jgi:REP element-mobilizing transposase RayT
MKKETYQSQKAFAGEKKPSMKRRFVGHDYTRRGIYMLTMTVEGRRPLFGRVYGSSDDARIELSELGCAVRDEWWNIPSYYPQVKVFELQMMPDHLHGILFVSEPLSCGLSRVVRGFKTGCGRAYRRLIAQLPVATESQQTMKENQQTSHPELQTKKGSHPEHGLLFEPGYNDLVLRTDDEYQRWKHYLRDNPRRLLMKRERPELLRPFFNMQLGSHRYNGIGNRELLSAPQRMAVRVSRRLTGQQLEDEVARYLEAARSGTVLISPAISPGEKRVMRQAFDLHLPTIVVLRNGFTPLSKPQGEQFDACAQGRLLMLSAWEHTNERITLTAYDCQQMNLMAIELSMLG